MRILCYLIFFSLAGGSLMSASVQEENSSLIPSRAEVPQEDCWNVECLFCDFGEWDRAFEEAREQLNLDAILSYRGRLGEGAKVLREVIDLSCIADRIIEKLYIYAHLQHDVDTVDNHSKISLGKIVALAQEFAEQTAWITPEILALEDHILNTYLDSDVFTDMRFYLEKIIRKKPHILSAEMEELMAQAGLALNAPSNTFRAMNDSDLDFGTVLNEKGEELELTHGTYSLFLFGNDRTLRKNAYKQLHKTYLSFENTLCETLQGLVQRKVFESRARNHNSTLDHALFGNKIDPQVYHSLIEAVHNGLPVLQRYISLRKKLLGYDELHFYDLYRPLIKDFEVTKSYQQAEEEVIAATAPLGKEYQDALYHGLMEQRWVDRYENQNKRSGAYSSGSYDTPPYILMNYKGKIRDQFTLMHEAGHSMHSLLTHQNQPYQYGNYSIFVAEVASTFNETLLREYLLSHSSSRLEKIYLLNQAIDDIRSTLFRQTMFAEFELIIHQLLENKTPLTPQRLKEEYLALNKLYFGDEITYDDEIEIEWARIPHFYSAFYVYQYATGISAALTLADKVLQGGNKEREAYLSFLKGGCSGYPIDLLKGAGVDMCTPDPVRDAIAQFDDLVTQLESLLQEEDLS